MEYVGLPIPGETLMAGLGYMCKTPVSVFFATTCSVAGTFAGSMLAYGIGYRLGEKIILKLGKPFHISEEKLNQSKVFLEKHEAAYVISSRFIPGVRHIVPYLTGIDHLNIAKISIYNLISSILWCGAFVGLGRLLDKKWTIIVTLVRSYTLLGLMILLFIFLVYRYLNKYKLILYTLSVSLFIFIKFCSELMEKELSTFDTAIYKELSRLITEDLTDIMIFISIFGSAIVLIPLAVLLVLITWKSQKYALYGKMAAVNLVVVSVLNEVFKLLFHRQRPDILRLVTVTGYSFPSGHSMVGMAFYGFILYLCFKNIKKPWNYCASCLLAVLIISIGISRIYLGVHYASDVIAGFSAGLAWLTIFIPLTNKLASAHPR